MASANLTGFGGSWARMTETGNSHSAERQSSEAGDAPDMCSLVVFYFNLLWSGKLVWDGVAHHPYLPPDPREIVCFF